jgi:hypothetical protein
MEPIEYLLLLLIFSVWCRFPARKIELYLFHNIQTGGVARPTSYPMDAADEEIGA